MNDVRTATLDDADAIAGINVRAWQYAYRGMLPDSYLASLDAVATARRVRDVITKGRDTLLVAVAQEVRGFAWMARSRDEDAATGTAELIAIYVEPAHGHQGIGRALMVASRETALAQGYACMSLWVLEQNAKARAFYQALGFVEDGNTKTTERWGGVLVREVRYAGATAVIGNAGA